jgi:hypothetical protein
MTKFDLAKAKTDIAAIVEIVKTVPEALQQRCFEMLFAAVFSETSAPADPPANPPREPAAKVEEEQSAKTPLSEKRLSPNVLAFARRQNVSQEELGKLFMLEHDPLLPIYKIPQGNVAKSQLTKVLMLLLENGLLNNSLTASYRELRESARDDGLFDSNFNKIFKRNSEFFKGAALKDGINDDVVVELSGTGMEKLAEIVRELAQ